MPERLAKKLLLIGWDGADWQIIKPLLERGEMPTLERIINDGVMGNLASMNPMISPMLWTTMATGKPPSKHGICGFYEPDPESERGVRLTNSTSRKCKAFWNILTQSQLKVHSVGWFASHPAEPINGVCVSDLFAKPVGTLEAGWPDLEGSVHPTELTSTLSDLRVHPQEISLEQIEYFVPQARTIDQTRDRNLSFLATQLAECATNQAAATWILETQEWDMLSVYFNTLDHICHAFMYYHPPRMDHIPQAVFETYKEVVDATYRFHDMMLGFMLEKAGDDVTVMIVSDHGYHSGQRRPILTPDEPAGPVVWHRPYGVLAMKGPHIRRDELVFGGRINDVTPTVLTLLGLPVADDMTGRPLCQVLDHGVEPERIASWEDVAGDAGMHSRDMQLDPFAEQSAMDQLVALGYLDPIPSDKQEAIRKATDEYQYNLGRSLIALGKLDEAVVHLEAVHRSQPTRLAVAFNLADCYQRLERREDCRRLIDYIAAGNCFENSLEDASVRVVPQLDLLYGMLEQSEGNLERSIEHFLRAEREIGAAQGLHTNIGNTYLKMERHEDAGRAFTRALEVDPDDPAAHHGMARVHLAEGRCEDAVESALASLEILYHQPRVHYLLGVALARLGNLERARHALEVSLNMNPNDQDVRWQLGALQTEIQRRESMRADAGGR